MRCETVRQGLCLGVVSLIFAGVTAGCDSGSSQIAPAPNVAPPAASADPAPAAAKADNVSHSNESQDSARGGTPPK